jgi:predicted  nucleic acid-binding Zn-ribbon protein
MLTNSMNPLDLTINQLKRATAIKEQMEALNKELRAIFGARADTRAAPKKKRTVSAATKKQIAAAQKARWANLRRANPTMQSVKSAAKAKKKTVSPATKAKLSAKLKAYWAAKKKSGKK